MKSFEYRPQGTCSAKMIIEINDDDTINDLKVIGGCPGNLQGIRRLIKGMKVDDVIDRLSGVCCGYKNTSCPDQLARALRLYKESSK